MQFRKFFHLLILSFLFFSFSNLALAQIIDISQDGEQIVVFPDGRWEFYDAAKATHQLAMQKYQDSLTSPEELLSDEFTTKGDSSEEAQNALLIAAAEEELALAIEKEKDARHSKMLLKDELKKMKNDDTISNEEYQKVKRQFKLAKRLEKNAKKKRKQVEKQLKKLKKNKEIASANKKKRKGSNKKLKKVDKTQNKLERELQDSNIAYQEDNNFYVASKRFKPYAMEEDVMYRPPTPDCNLEFDGVDEFIGKKRKDVAKDLFFTHTEDDMRRYMKEDEYIICEGNLTQISGGTLLLNLFFSIKSNDAKRAFGLLDKGSVILIKLIDGTKITLANNQADAGVYDTRTRRHNYTAQYIINSGQEKKLRNGEVDKVRVIWETGYEDYEVYNLDFFANQMRCLKN